MTIYHYIPELTPEATYETTRGTFKLLGRVGYSVTLERADKRRVQVALSDWLTWGPKAVAEYRDE